LFGGGEVEDVGEESAQGKQRGVSEEKEGGF